MSTVQDPTQQSPASNRLTNRRVASTATIRTSGPAGKPIESPQARWQSPEAHCPTGSRAQRKRQRLSRQRRTHQQSVLLRPQRPVRQL